MAREPTIGELAAQFARGTLSAAELAERTLANIADPQGEGARAYRRVNANLVAEAKHADARRASGLAGGALAGVPVSIKDLFDEAGQATLAGSVALSGAPKAAADAPVVARLRAAGALITGRSNMSEFAFSTLGLNPHYGTPLCPYDRATRRIPGGSSSGAAVSVSDAMAVAAIGSDTGGSVRIPASLCGLVGFKPTAARVPLAGLYPLAPSLDSIGPIARSVACCALLDSVMSGGDAQQAEASPTGAIRLLVPTNLVVDDLDAPTGAAFERALARLAAAGVRITHRVLPELAQAGEFVADGGMYSYEAFQHHAPLLETHADQYDPRVRARIEAGATYAPERYAALLRLRVSWIAAMQRQLADCSALAMPTTPMIAPPLAPLERSDDLYVAANRLMGRNARIFNLLDGCAISLPCTPAGAAPVGFMLGGPAMSDARILSVAATLEAVLGGQSAPG